MRMLGTVHFGGVLGHLLSLEDVYVSVEHSWETVAGLQKAQRSQDRWAKGTTRIAMPPFAFLQWKLGRLPLPTHHWWGSYPDPQFLGSC
jgi:hypothetical protein